VETQFGYHIILVTDRKGARTVPLEEVADNIRKELENSAAQRARNEFVDELREDADVEYDESVKSTPPTVRTNVRPAPSKPDEKPDAGKADEKQGDPRPDDAKKPEGRVGEKPEANKGDDDGDKATATE
jgi:hypothetical protein